MKDPALTDEVIEKRLGKIAASSLAPVPGSLYEYVRGLPEEYPMADSRHSSPRLLGFRWGLIGTAGAMVVVVILAIAGSLLIVHLGQTAPAASPTLTPATATTAASASPTPTPSPLPSATASAVPNLSGFTTPGKVPGSWKSLTWSNVPADSPLASIRKIVPWRGGYVASSDAGYWSSNDGIDWTPITTLGAKSADIVESPNGLLAFDSPDDQSAPHTVWASSDGKKWQSLGDSSALAGDSISVVAGNKNGLVAVLGTNTGGAVMASTDGMSWNPVTLPGGAKLCWCGTGNGPVWVSSGAGRLFLVGYLGTADSPNPVGVFWSAGGASWTRAKGTFQGLPGFDFASGGILARTSPGEVPFAEAWLVSTDDGTSWQALKTLAPIGIQGCSGSCSGSGAPDGALYADGSRILAVKTSGQAWTSSDGVNWVSLSFGGRPLKTSDPSQSEVYLLRLLPAGLYVNGSYGAGQ